MTAALSAGPAAASDGLSVDYCIFCYHGTSLLRADNGALLTKFVSERGFLLPKRFSKCCAKHQRALSRTVRRARCLNLLPWHAKWHPRLRFAGMAPAEAGGGGDSDEVAAAPREAPPPAALARAPGVPAATIDALLAEVAERSSGVSV